MRVVIDRCTFCGRKLTEEEFLNGHCYEIGFGTVCEHCFSLSQKPYKSNKNVKQIDSRDGSVKKSSHSGLKLSLKGVATALFPFVGLAFVVFLFVVMLGFHKHISRTKILPFTRPRARLSSHLPPLLQHILIAEYLPQPSSSEGASGGRVKLVAKDTPKPRLKEEPNPPQKKSSLNPSSPKIENRKNRKEEKNLPTERPSRKNKNRRPLPKVSFTPRIQEKVLRPQGCEERKRLIERIKEALEKGRKALTRLQDSNGIWRFGKYSRLDCSDYDFGCTALALWALLAAGEPRNSPVIQRGFKALMKVTPKRTYTAALILLAVEAYCRKAGIFGPHFRTVVKRNFRLTNMNLRNLAKRALNFLIWSQLPNGCWSYSSSSFKTTPKVLRRKALRDRHRRRGSHRWDLSNTQFAMLGLDAALRMGLSVPTEVFKRNLKTMLNVQETTGCAYHGKFFVPAAELSIKDLRRLERKAASGASTLSDFSERFRRRIATVADNRKADRMVCRGFSYTEMGNVHNVRFSMTAAGLANLVISKMVLEKRKALGRMELKRLKKAIRDAAAWIAVCSSPLDRLSFYDLLSLERAGVMAVVERFGDLDWHRQGALVILKRQSSDGLWKPYRGIFDGNRCVSTSFALLFLARGVAGSVGAPGLTDVVETGKGLFRK